MKRYLIENEETQEDFSVYAESPKGAIEKALLQLGEEAGWGATVDDLARQLRVSGYLCYPYGEEPDFDLERVSKDGGEK